ncbi:hypothetical protein ACTTAL_05590 [Rhodobacter capsulatus]|uniref:hypothetical protein n=1 Tax=Rhodobacter capsulatus TaxID=1061 RepID=UPI0003D3524D|nr:hypothetical protein [Rhodobacter capsulatus]ETD89392.1 hypothetical protein U713_10085 [Rhodobacter capsulatus YW2]
MPWELSGDMNGLRLAQPEVAAPRCPSCGLFFDYDLEAMGSKRKATPVDLTFTLEFLPIVSRKIQGGVRCQRLRGARFKLLCSGQYRRLPQMRCRKLTVGFPPLCDGPRRDAARGMTELKASKSISVRRTLT